jgi:hypothetical protein
MFDRRAADRVQRKYHTPILFVASIIALAAVGRGVAQAEDRWYLAGAATGSATQHRAKTLATSRRSRTLRFASAKPPID